jgi:8-oxo-dGTP pyrophosphatase MutT (NUDIX family)
MSILDYENQRLLDVVDENDKVVGSVTRGNAHYTGELHREVHVWMRDNNDNIIFQIRGLNRDNAGLLDATAGGHVEEGEDYMEAAVRETKEETGFEISPSELSFLKTVRGSEISKDPLGVKNNFFRAVYLYKPAIDYKKIKKESGIPGGGFQKISLEFLSHPDKNIMEAVIPFVLKEELPLIFKHLK